MDYVTAETAIKTFFNGFDIETVSLILLRNPRESENLVTDNSHYCFVELADREQADAAVEALDWKEMRGTKIRVKYARET